MSNDDSAGKLPNWKCDECGESFSAMTRDQLKNKVEQHRSDCETPEIWECEQCGWTVRKDADYYGEAKGRHIQECQCRSWYCPRCGQQYEAKGESRLNELKERHKEESKCYSDPLYHPNSHDINSQEIPRDPQKYRPTDHFAVRKAKRKEPAVEGDVIEKLITDGAIYNTQSASRVFFERKVDGWTWRLFVELIDEAFTTHSKKHLVVTIYAKESDQHEVAYDLGI